MRDKIEMIDRHVARTGCRDALDDKSAGRVLVVDDDRSLRGLLALFLNGVGFDVATAENGQAGLELFRRRPFDLIITDLQMPVMNGLELMAGIKRASQHTPVVLMTGLNTPEVARFSRAAAAVLYKPFQFEELKNAVDLIFRLEEHQTDRRACTAHS